MKVVWTFNAINRQEQIFCYIVQDNKEAAKNFLFSIEQAVDNLARFPYLAHIGRIQNTRELLIFKSYLLIYTVFEDTITIIDIVHTSQQYPPTK